MEVAPVLLVRVSESTVSDGSTSVQVSAPQIVIEMVGSTVAVTRTGSMRANLPEVESITVLELSRFWTIYW